MKPTLDQITVTRGGDIQERAMDIDADAKHLIFGVLRKNLYSNPIASLIREYTVNAQDEHRKYCPQTPIVVSLPNYFETSFKVRDYGKGLTDEQVFHFFGKYGASGKRDDNSQVGMYGLGCKSAFAYTDAYTVTSFQNGKASVFSLFIDETHIGSVAKMGESDTTEPDGLEISIPVQKYDINTFVQTALETVKYFKVTPEIRGLNYTPTFERKKVVTSGDGWEYYGAGTPSVLMGEISYPIDSDAMGDIARWETQLLNNDLRIIAEIGEVEVTGSREALMMSPKTIAAIRKRLVAVKTQMISETETAFKTAKTLLEALSLYHSTLNAGGGYGEILREANGGKIKWNGVEISDNVLRFDEKSPHAIKVYNKSRWRKKVSYDLRKNLAISADTKFYFDDTDGKIVGYSRRINTLIENAKQPGHGSTELTVCILTTTDIPALEKVLGQPVSSFESFKAIPETYTGISRLAQGADKAKRKKHQQRLFKLNVKKLLSDGFYKTSASDFYDGADVDVNNTAGLYVKIDRFQPNVGDVHNLRQFKELLGVLEKAGLTCRLPIYGVKTGQATGNLLAFDKWVAKKLNSKAATKTRYLHSLALAYHENALFNVASVKPANVDNPNAKRYVELYKVAQENASRYGTGKYEVHRRAFKFAGVTVKADKEIVTLSKEYLTRYPMISLVSDSYRNDSKAIAYMRERDALTRRGGGGIPRSVRG
jgi:hypothetical protein